MTPPTLFVLSILVTGACHAATGADADGLITLHSRHLDEVRVRPQVDLAAYRRVLIEPAPVNLRTEANINQRYPRRIAPEEANLIVREAASSIEAALVEAFKARGYEIAAASGPGVLRLSPRVAELVVNAPDDPMSGRTYAFTREAGEATLVVDARDALSGDLLASIRHKDTAGQLGRLNIANEVTNRFWFEGFFRRWAVDCADVLRSPAAQ